MKFQDLDINKKIEHLLLILDDMKWFNESVDKLVISLQKWDIQDSFELDRLYNLVIESIKESNEEFDNKRLDNFEKNKNLVSYLREKEEQERLEEQYLISIDF